MSTLGAVNPFEPPREAPRFFESGEPTPQADGTIRAEWTYSLEELTALHVWLIRRSNRWKVRVAGVAAVAGLVLIGLSFRGFNEFDGYPEFHAGFGLPGLLCLLIAVPAFAFLLRDRSRARSMALQQITKASDEDRRVSIHAHGGGMNIHNARGWHVVAWNELKPCDMDLMRMVGFVFKDGRVGGLPWRVLTPQDRLRVGRWLAAGQAEGIPVVVPQLPELTPAAIRGRHEHQADDFLALYEVLRPRGWRRLWGWVLQYGVAVGLGLFHLRSALHANSKEQGRWTMVVIMAGLVGFFVARDLWQWLSLRRSIARHLAKADAGPVATIIDRQLIQRTATTASILPWTSLGPARLVREVLCIGHQNESIIVPLRAFAEADRPRVLEEIRQRIGRIDQPCRRDSPR